MKISTLFILFFVTLSFIANSQENAISITNIKTAEYSSLPGNNLFLKLPEGFTAAPHFTGWQNKTGSRIILSKKQTSLAEKLAEVETRNTREGYFSERKKLMINNNKAILIEATGNPISPQEKNILLIEKNEAIHIIETKNNIESKERNILKSSILTVFFEK